MDFRDYATKETSALVTRLLAAQSKNSVQQLQAFRKALDAATKAIESAVNASPDFDDEVVKLTDRLMKAVASEVEAQHERVFEEAKATIEAARAELKAAAAEREKLADRVEELEGQADTLRGELKSYKDRVDAARSEVAQARNEVAQARNEAAQARNDLLQARDAQKKSEAARADAEAARKHEAKSKAAVEAELQEARELLDSTVADAEKFGHKLEAAAAEKAKLAAALTAVQSQLQSVDAQRQTVTALSKSNAARVQTLERTLAEADRKFGALLQQAVGAFQSLAKAESIGEVLTEIVSGLSSEFSRVALFCVRGNRLEGEHQVGFEFKGDITNVVMPLSVDSLLTRAVSSRRIERLSAAELKDSKSAPFGGSPTCALALPIVVEGETLAVVYGDDSGQKTKDSVVGGHEVKARYAELLLRHADVLMVRLATELQAVGELREYAHMLITEAEKMHAADLRAGKKDKEVKTRLKENIEYARRTYAERAAEAGPAAASILDERIASVIEDKSGTAFGRDLAAVASRSKRAAEAS
jgi:uncharacterized phage infection (PIP) family protein YhgE